MNMKSTRRSFAIQTSALVGASAFPILALAKAGPKWPSYRVIVRAVFGAWNQDPNALPLGVTYILPQLQSGKESSDGLLGGEATALHYSWQDDADSVYATIAAKCPEIRSSIESTGYAKGTNIDPGGFSGFMKSALDNRFHGAAVAYQSFINGNDLSIFFGGFTSFFAPYRRYGIVNEGQYSIVNWAKVPYIKTGFKLDTPGIGAYLTASFKTITEAEIDNTLWDSTERGNHLVHRSVKSLYFTGDSFSHYGGWVEGAFQSALNTTAGILKSALAKKGLASNLQSTKSLGLLSNNRWPLDYGVTPVMSHYASNGVTRTDEKRPDGTANGPWFGEAKANSWIDISFDSTKLSATKQIDLSTVKYLDLYTASESGEMVISGAKATLPSGAVITFGVTEGATFAYGFSPTEQLRYCLGLFIEKSSSTSRLKGFQFVFRNS